jgi:glycosyltransferase involved in cell wall biosynthesis
VSATPSEVSVPSTFHKKEPVPILLMVRELDHGGVERDVTKIALHLDRTRFLPHVATYYAEGMRYEELRSAGIPILHLPVRKLVSTETIRSGCKLFRYIHVHGIKVVHSFDASGVFGLAIARMARVPVVIGSQLGYRDILDPNTQRLLRFADRYSHAILVNCEAMRRHMIDDEHVPDDRIELCYNGVDTVQFYPGPAVKPVPVADASLVIGTVSVLRPEKALDLLQEAFARIRHLKPGMKLLIVGSGPELSRLEANSRRLGLQNQCVFVPATPLVPEYLRVFDIFVSCSSSEAFSNAILEAMACGICAVGSNVGGTPELIGNDVRGLLFQSGDAGDLANKLNTLIENDGLRREFGTRAAEFARTTLSIEIAARRMADIYETMLRRKAAW